MKPSSPSPAFSRRAFLGASASGLVAAALPAHLRGSAAGASTAPAPAAATGNPPRPPAALAPLNRFPRMMQEFHVARVRELDLQASARRERITTRSEAEAYVREVREKILGIFGPWPEKTPLNPRVTGIVERDTYHIEKVIFESRPGFPVTANLYLPRGRRVPLPGVIGTCGHSANGKAAEPYQSFAQGLARMGYVTLIFDPLGQGERLQYPGPDLKSRHGAGVREHLQAGNQQFLVGDFLGSWRAWDGMRALDYLLTRPEVNPELVGVTGISGGGTDSAWLCGVESRWAMAAPGCFVITFRRNLENELPADTEQCPPRALALGLDHADFIAAMAPKPVILLDQEKDYFDVRGLEEAMERLRPLYRLLGREEDIQMYLGPDYHGYSKALREAMYRWFNRVTGISDAEAEPRLVVEKDETLWCTPRGQLEAPGTRTVFSFTREASAALRHQRVALNGEALREAVRDALKLPSRDGVPEYRILRPTRRAYPKPHAATYAVETEEGVFALVTRLADEPLLSRPPRGHPRAILYISHRSADAELRDDPWLAELMRSEPDAAFFACDVRGIGESQPNTTGVDFLNPYGPDYFYAIHGIMLDRPYVGQRTHDVLRVLDWLKDNGSTSLHLAARGWGALPATFAALLSPIVNQVTLRNALTSYSDVAETEDYAWPLSALLPGVLRRFDLPDCYRELHSRQLRLIEPWDGRAGT